MNVFTIDEYQGLTPDNQELVNQWLEKYGLIEISMVLSMEYKLGGRRLAAYSVVPAKHFEDPAKPEDYEYFIDSEFCPGTFTKVAEFNYDDFPWEVMEVGD